MAIFGRSFPIPPRGWAKAPPKQPVVFPEGFSNFFDRVRQAPVSPAQQRYEAFTPRGSIVSTTPQGWGHFYFDSRVLNPLAPAQQRYEAYPPRAIVSTTPPGFGGPVADQFRKVQQFHQFSTGGLLPPSLAPTMAHISVAGAAPLKQFSQHQFEAGGQSPPTAPTVTRVSVAEAAPSRKQVFFHQFEAEGILGPPPAVAPPAADTARSMRQDVFTVRRRARVIE